jgi:membrane protein
VISAREGWRLLKETALSWSGDYAPSMGAALSYYTLFSIAPLLIIVIAVAGMVFGDEAARGALFGELRGLTGDQGAKAVEDMVAAADKPREGAAAGVIGILVLLLGATTVFGELQNALDRIWRAPAREKSSGWWKLIRTRLLSFGMVLGIAFLLMVSLVLSAALSALGRLWAFPGWETLSHALDIAVSFALTTALFALIYKFIPRVHVAWADVWIGAGVTALLFAVGKFLIGLYIGKSAVASTFGAAGSLVVLMLWVYYSAQIFLFGAEFTWVYANEHGSRRGQKREVEQGTPTKPVALVPVSAVAARNAPVYGPRPVATPRRYQHPFALLGGAFAAGLVLAIVKNLASRPAPARPWPSRSGWRRAARARP